MYIPAVAVFSAEVLKLAVSLSMLVREKRREQFKGNKEPRVKIATRALRNLLVEQRGEMLKLAIPAALYALQNTLLVSHSSFPSSCGV